MLSPFKLLNIVFKTVMFFKKNYRFRVLQPLLKAFTFTLIKNLHKACYTVALLCSQQFLSSKKSTLLFNGSFCLNTVIPKN